MKKLVFILMLFCLCALFVGGCAKRIAPDGGPKDLRPPNLVTISPAHNSTTVPTNTTIELVFDEPISANEAAIIVFPHDENFDKKFSRKKVQLVPKKPLETNQTYSVIITTKFADWQKNTLAQPQVYAFSTSSTLDTMHITGKVFAGTSFAAAKGAIVLAYDSDDISRYPVGIAFCDTFGAFVMQNLTTSPKLLLAFTGIGSKLDLALAKACAIANDFISPQNAETAELLLFEIDTLPPQIASEKYENGIGKIKCDEKLIVNGTHELVWISQSDSTTVNVLFSALKDSIELCDRNGNCAYRKLTVPKTQFVDTFPPQLRLAKKLDKASMFPLTVEIDEPVRGNLSVGSTRPNRQVVVRQVNTTTFSIECDNEKIFGDTLVITTTQLVDFAGNNGADSVKIAIAQDDRGSIELLAQKKCERERIAIVGPTQFFTDPSDEVSSHKLPAGEYLLYRFCDTNGNGNLDAGKIAFNPPRIVTRCERFEFFEKKVSIREGWSTDIDWK